MPDLTIFCKDRPGCQLMLAKAAQKLVVTVSDSGEPLSMVLSIEVHRRFVHLLEEPMAIPSMSDNIAESDSGGTFLYLYCIGAGPDSDEPFKKSLMMETDELSLEVVLSKGAELHLQRFIALEDSHMIDDCFFHEKPVFNL